MPYPHQTTALKLLKDNDVYALFMEMGTGKTLVAIQDADRMLTNQYVNITVVICPNTVKDVWIEEINKWGLHTSYVKWPRITSSPRIKQPDNPHYLIINVEAFSSVNVCMRLATRFSLQGMSLSFSSSAMRGEP